MNPDIRLMVEEDWSQVKQIYLNGIATGNATFETQAPEWTEWKQNHDMRCTIVADLDAVIMGWASLSPVSDRCVYTGVGENSVYVHSDFKEQGLGKLLLSSLIKRSEELGYWTIQTGIFPENRSSIVLHAKLGFRVVGLRERLGKMENRWRDVVLLERRSQTIGVD